MGTATPALTGVGPDSLAALKSQGALREFSLQELMAATDGFSKPNLIGEGGFGRVYRGSMLLPGRSALPQAIQGRVLPPGTLGATSEGARGNAPRGNAPQGNALGNPHGVALGQAVQNSLEPPAPSLEAPPPPLMAALMGAPPLVLTKIAVKQFIGGRDEDREQFNKEAVLLGTLRHPNLVRMHGVGGEGPACLVLELMEGSLDKALASSREGRHVFSWRSRLKVMRGAASGLEFLHSKSVIHRDIKPGNILLARDYTTKLTDFGMIRLRADGELQTLVYTRVMGTRHYIDPSYLSTRHLGYASDVYSFGIVLMELITGQRAEGAPYVGRIRRDFEKASEGVIPWSIVADPAMGGGYNEAQVRVVAALAAWCTAQGVRERPTMAHVRGQLDNLDAPMAVRGGATQQTEP